MATTPIRGRSRWNSAAECGIGQTATSTIASSRIIGASRADVDRCSASRASHQQGDIAEVMTNSGTSFALDPICANTFPPLRDAFTIYAGPPSRSVSWKLLKRQAPQPEHVAYEQARTLTEPFAAQGVAGSAVLFVQTLAAHKRTPQFTGRPWLGHVSPSR
jgi:hypothetical protein